MSIFHSIVKQYTAPTCNLDILARSSASSGGSQDSTVSKLFFELQCQDSQVTLQGDLEQLQALHQVVSTYVQTFLNTPEPHPESDGLTLDHQSPNPLTESDYPETLTHHTLNLGNLASETSGTELSLSTLQLFDLIATLDAYKADKPAALEIKRNRLWGMPIAGVRAAAVAIVTLGVGAAIAQWSYRPSTEMATSSAPSTPLAKGSPPNPAFPSPGGALPAVPQLPNPTSTSAAGVPPSPLPVPPPPDFSAETQALDSKPATFAKEDDPLAKLIAAQKTTAANPFVQAPARSAKRSAPKPPVKVATRPQAPLTNRSTAKRPPQLVEPTPGLIEPTPLFTATPDAASSDLAQDNQPSRTAEALNPAAPAMPPAPATNPSVAIAPSTQQPPPNPGSSPSAQDLALGTARTRSAAQEPATASSSSAQETATATGTGTGTVFDTIQQVAEVRLYFQERWRPPQGINQALEYHLTLNPDGSLKQIAPLGQAAGVYLDRTNMPLLNEPFVSPVASGKNAKIRLVLTPDGKVQTFLEALN